MLSHIRNIGGKLSRSKTPLRLVFWLAVVLFGAAGARLSVINRSDGGWDSASNLITARSLATGHGFTTLQVQDLVERHSIPGRETVRAPGIPVVMAAVFRVTGTSPAAVVAVNVLTVLLAALSLRAAVRRVAPSWLAEVAGLLVIASPNNYELVSLVNNNALTLSVSLGLLIAASAKQRGWSGVRVAVLCGLLGAAAFLVKQSYILGFAAFATVLLGSDTRYRLRSRLARIALAGSLMAVLSAPYWYPNLRDYGTPLYSPIQKLRLPLRYGLLPLDGYQRAVYLDRTVPSYGEIARLIGVRAMLRRELDIVRLLPPPILERGALVLLWSIATLVFIRRKHWPVVVAALTLAIPPFFDALWWLPEPRYFYPLFPVLLFIGAIGTGDYLVLERRHVQPVVGERFRLAFAVLMLVATVDALLETRWGWRREFAQARTPIPSWVAAAADLPNNALIMTAYPPEVSWWSGHPTVIEPMGSRPDLETVMKAYRPAFYLDLATGERPDRPPFTETELRPIASGGGWVLYEIAR